jgi:O-acetyl-ADP-ribose deacetylase (regulator of RNase III)
MNRIIRELEFESRVRFQLVRGDITAEEVDAIVNAANSHLKHGGGVAGAIVRKGGKQIQVESDAWVKRNGPVSHETPAYTSGGNLPCRYVIHVVGPVWGEGEEDEKLSSAVLGALKIGDQLDIASLALPAISTGIFGFPKDPAARIIIEEIHNYLTNNLETGLQMVRLTLFDLGTLNTFLEVWTSEFGDDKEK